MDYKYYIAEFLRHIDNERFLRAIYISVRDYVLEMEDAECAISITEKK